MKSQSVWQRTLGFLGSKPVIVETSSAQLTSDAGLLPMREFDESLGFTRRFADALEDTRDVRYTTHSFLEMTRARVFGILADYEDQNDHDALRHDPIFKVIAGGSLAARWKKRWPVSRHIRDSKTRLISPRCSDFATC